MTRLTLSFPAPTPVELATSPDLALTFPAPQAVVLQVQGIQAASGAGSETDLGYVAATRLLTSSSGADVTLPLADGTNAGLMSSASVIALGAALQPGALIPWADISGKPATFPPSTHSHDIADVTGLQASLDGKAATVHAHVAADVTDFASAARGTVLTGYAAAGSRIALAASDSILGAFGKLGKWVADLAAVAFSGSASDLTAGTLPAARFDDTAHGARAGGTLHPAATTSVAGFMSGADKTKLDGIATGAQVNVPTDLSYTAGTRLLASSTGADATLPLVVAAGDAGLMTGADKTKLDGIATGANNYSHPNHTGDVTSVGDGATTIAADAVTNAKLANMAANSIKGNNTGSTADPVDLNAAQVRTLINVADGATANASDASLRDRATHTGTQLAATISDFSEAVDDRVAALAVAGTNMTITYNDGAGTLTFDAAGGGGVSDGDKGDITVTSGGTVWTIDAVSTDIGTFGLPWALPQITVNAKGQVTAVDAIAIEITSLSISDVTVAGRAMLRAATPAAQTALLDAFTATQDGLVPAPVVPSGLFLKDDGTWAAPAGGVSDGDKGDITVTASGATWTIDAAAVTLAKMADMATGSLIYRKTAGSGAPEVNTLATLKTDLGLTGTNSGDQTSIVGITGTKAQFDTAVTDGNFLYVGDVTSNATHTGDVTGDTALTIAADAVTNAKLANVATATIKGRATAGTGDPEDLTGTQATALLDTVTSGAKGLAPASGGGTTNFLRADGTWTAPGGVSDGDKGDVTVSASGATWHVNPKVKFGLPLAMARRLQF